MDRLTKIQDHKIKCSCCGKEQLVKDMKFAGVQEGCMGMAYSLALYNCDCRSTQCVKIERGDNNENTKK
jgi:hypothetical protein